jgi:S-adenosyl methyltransferase
VTTGSAAGPGGAGGTAPSGPGEKPPFDTSVAHIARVYDYWLGGKDNYAADRVAGDAALEAYPGLVSSVRANRAYLSRVVRYLADQAGIRQFLDIGTGIPTANNTHEVAQRLAPESRIVYVDNDPIVLAHARALLASNKAGATDYTVAAPLPGSGQQRRGHVGRDGAQALSHRAGSGSSSATGTSRVAPPSTRNTSGARNTCTGVPWERVASVPSLGTTACSSAPGASRSITWVEAPRNTSRSTMADTRFGPTWPSCP